MEIVKKLINNYLLLKGWTVGISDIICDSDTGEEVSQILKKMKASSAAVSTPSRSPVRTRSRGRPMPITRKAKFDKI